jgi:hypothetical protein
VHLVLHACVQDASEMIALAERLGVKLLLPCDVRVSNSLDAPLNMKTTVLTQSCCSPDKPCIPAGGYMVVHTQYMVVHTQYLVVHTQIMSGLVC